MKDFESLEYTTTLRNIFAVSFTLATLVLYPVIYEPVIRSGQWHSLIGQVPQAPTLVSALHDQCGNPPSMAILEKPVNPGVASAGKKFNQGRVLRATNCSRNPYSKRGFGPARGRASKPMFQTVAADLVPDGPAYDPALPRERVVVERNCTGNLSVRELRKTCRRSFIVWTAVGFVEVKCGERLWSGMANPSSECGNSNFQGLMLLVQPYDGQVIAATVDDEMRYHGLAVIATFPEISACSSADGLEKQPLLQSVQFNHGEWTWWTSLWGATNIPSSAMFDPSTPELKLLASAITTITKEERIRECRPPAFTVASASAKEVVLSVLISLGLFFAVAIFPPSGKYYFLDASLSAPLGVSHFIMCGHHLQLYKFARLIEVDGTPSLAFTVWHLACYCLLALRITIPLELLHLGVTRRLAIYDLDTAAIWKPRDNIVRKNAQAPAGPAKNSNTQPIGKLEKKLDTLKDRSTNNAIVEPDTQIKEVREKKAPPHEPCFPYHLDAPPRLDEDYRETENERKRK